MIFINARSSNIVKAKQNHYEMLSAMITNRLTNNSKLKNIPSEQRNFLRSKIIPELKKILIGQPAQLKTLTRKIKFSNENRDAVKELLKYAGWFREKKTKPYNAFELAKNLDINTCVYCNRNYTSTVEKITRPQFDHYFPQGKYPLLALSFYNLIPCCSICNTQIKGTSELNLKEHLHPYIDNQLNYFNFSYSYNTEMKDSLAIKIKCKKGSKAEKTLQFFKTTEIYNAHTDELRDLIKLRSTFSDNYLRILSENVLKGTKIGKDELYQLAFGVYLDEKNISKRPFSKFKKDILTELGIIE